jgi:hypothetical protein
LASAAWCYTLSPITMLQAHSFLWHYGWIAPNILTVILAGLIWRHGIHKRYPAFFGYLLFASVEGLTLYALDLAPSISFTTWWYAFWVGTIMEGIFKFVVVAELLHHLLHPWPSIARLGRNLVSGAGVLLVLLAAVTAAFAAPDNTPLCVGGAHILSQALYLTEAGVIVSIFVFAACFKIPWDRTTFGIALTFGIVWCEHLAVWALIAGGVFRNRGWEDFANMGAYHLGILIWFYFILVPQKITTKSAVIFPDHNLEVWNQEVERFLHP